MADPAETACHPVAGCELLMVGFLHHAHHRTVDSRAKGKRCGIAVAGKTRTHAGIDRVIFGPDQEFVLAGIGKLDLFQPEIFPDGFSFRA